MNSDSLAPVAMETYGPLYAKSSQDKIKMWKAEAHDDGRLVTTHGYEDGKQTSNTKRVKGKNIGKINETSCFQQACNEAQSKMNKKMDEGYVLDKAELDGQELLLPMLAHPYAKRKHNIEWPAFVQPKLNGVRCIATGEKYLTRKGKEWDSLGHLDADVKKLLETTRGTPGDGEIFHPEWGFQEIIRAVKKYRPGVSEQLEYWVYDTVDTELDFEDRLRTKLQSLTHYEKIKIVPTYEVINEEEMMAKHEEFTKAGFEGTIVRNKQGTYELKNRSKNLQKYKDFLDDEFEIVGGEEASGNDAGTVIFICKLQDPSERTFSVRPKGSRETRKRWLTELDSIIGKQLTVRYQELSEDGVPIFPVGLAIRNYE